MHLCCLQRFPGCWSLVLLRCGGKRCIVRFLLMLLLLFLVSLLGVWRSLLLLDLFTRPVLSLSFMVCVAASHPTGSSYLRLVIPYVKLARYCLLPPVSPPQLLPLLTQALWYKFPLSKELIVEKGEGEKGEEGITVSSGTFKHIFFKDSGVQSSVCKLQ